MGWAAARGELDGGGWALFAILGFWQMPHFFAIAWIYRDEYARADFQMLPNVTRTEAALAGSRSVTRWPLLAVSLCPVSGFHLAGPVYSCRRGGALAWCFLWCSINSPAI
jgi:protoheme IX farnesyltransferase